MTAPSGWEGILDEGESILWQGQPEYALNFRKNWKTTLSGIPFLGFSLFWTFMATTMTQAGGAPGPVAIFFPLWGVMFVCIGLYLVVGHVLWDAYKRRHTWYTLTNERAIIATDVPMQGRRLKSYPINSSTSIEIRPGKLATVSFASETVRTRNGSRERAVGFEEIEKGADVYQLIRRVQRGEV